MVIQVETLEQSYDVVAPHAAEVVERMYASAFARHPGLRHLFVGIDMEEQRAKFLATLSFVRKSARDPASLVSVLQLLGAQHRRYGVLPEHYPILGTALVEAMAAVGGVEWLAEYTQARADAYERVQLAMLSDAPMHLW